MSAVDGGGVGAPISPEIRAGAERLFGDRLALTEQYAWLLATDGVVRGLIGPREAPRIWDRHLLNCAVLEARVPLGSRVTDVGSGAGLPGLVLALARPDLTVTLIDSMARRVTFLTEVVAALGLGDQVQVVRGRAEQCADQIEPAAVVTARAVAPLDQLARWCLPLAVPGGVLLAIKGESAADEVAEHTPAVRRAGGGTPVVYEVGRSLVSPPTTVVEIVRARPGGDGSAGARSRRRR